MYCLLLPVPFSLDISRFLEIVNYLSNFFCDNAQRLFSLYCTIVSTPELCYYAYTGGEFMTNRELLETIVIKLESIDQRLDRVEQRLDKVEQRLDRVEQRLDKVEQRLDLLEQRFDSLEQRVTSLEQHFDSLEQRFDSLEHRFDSLEQRVISLESTTAEIKGIIGHMDQRITNIELTLENEVSRNICTIAEAHLDLSRKFDQALKIKDDDELVRVRLNVLENDVRKIKQRLEIA